MVRRLPTTQFVNSNYLSEYAICLYMQNFYFFNEIISVVWIHPSLSYQGAGSCSNTGPTAITAKKESPSNQALMIQPPLDLPLNRWPPSDHPINTCVRLRLVFHLSRIYVGSFIWSMAVSVKKSALLCSSHVASRKIIRKITSMLLCAETAGMDLRAAQQLAMDHLTLNEDNSFGEMLVPHWEFCLSISVHQNRNQHVHSGKSDSCARREREPNRVATNEFALETNPLAHQAWLTLNAEKKTPPTLPLDTETACWANHGWIFCERSTCWRKYLGTSTTKMPIQCNKNCQSWMNTLVSEQRTHTYICGTSQMPKTWPKRDKDQKNNNRWIRCTKNTSHTRQNYLWSLYWLKIIRKGTERLGKSFTYRISSRDTFEDNNWDLFVFHQLPPKT